MSQRYYKRKNYENYKKFNVKTAYTQTDLTGTVTVTEL
jgi:hypothetical protein